MTRKGILQGSSQRSGSETQMSSGNPNIRRFREVFDDLRATAIQDIETDRIGASRFSSRIEILAVCRIISRENPSIRKKYEWVLTQQSTCATLLHKK